MQNITILIAGATGMVGKALVSFLKEKGFSVIIVTRNIKGASAVFGKEVNALSWVQLSEESVIQEIKCDVIINLVGANIGAKSWTDAYKTQILESRVNSVKKLEDLVNRMLLKPKVWIQASAIGSNGKGEEKGKGFLADVVSKWEEVFNKTEIESARKVTLRFGVVLSQTEGMLYQMRKAFNYGVAVCAGNGKQKLTWIHIDDLIKIIFQSISNEQWHGVINAVAPNSISMWEFTKALKRNSKAVIALKLPSFVFQFVLGKQKANELVLASQNVKPEKLIKYNFQYHYKSLEDAL